MLFGDCKAAEPLRNLSLGVKEGKMIRNVRNRLDFEREVIVFVCKVPRVGQDSVFEIEVGEMVRYKRVHENLFGGI